MEPIAGNLQSAYTFYQLPNGKSEYDKSFSRDETTPPHTNYTVGFKGTLDYIFYNEDVLTLLQLLEIPKESQLSKNKAIPSLMFPSDHVRIEAEFLLPN